LIKVFKPFFNHQANVQGTVWDYIGVDIVKAQRGLKVENKVEGRTELDYQLQG